MFELTMTEARRIISLAALVILLAASVVILAPTIARADSNEPPGQHIVVDGSSGCALDSEAKLVCWGGYREVSFEGTFTHVFKIFMGSRYGSGHRADVRICALSPEGELPCWKSNSSGNQSDIYSGDSYAWVSGSSDVFCEMTAAGGVSCGEAEVWYYMEAPPLAKFLQVSAGGYACGLTTAGSIRCWGMLHNREAYPPCSLSTTHRSRHGKEVQTGCGLRCGDLRIIE